MAAVLPLNKIFLYSVVLFWMFVAVYFLGGTGSPNSTTIPKDVANTVKMMEELQKQNIQLKEIAAEMRSLDVKNSNVKQMEDLLKSVRSELAQCEGRSKHLKREMEERLREKEAQPNVGMNVFKPVNSSYAGILSTYNQVKELTYFLNSELQSIQKDTSLTSSASEKMNRIIDDVKSRTRAALIEVELMKETEESEQAQTMEMIAQLIQKKVQKLQNPEDCSTAKKIICDLKKHCGFGCQFHHLTYCFLVAIGTDRTLILKSKGWIYSSDGWDSVFMPLSDTCTEHTGGVSPWRGESAAHDELAVSLPIIDSMQHKPPYLPLSIPSELSKNLTMYHGNPVVWWIGQLEKYLTRPQPWLEQKLQKFEEDIGFQHPIVGIHVRRTDKVGTEAAFHGIDEYMTHAIDWFEKEDMKRARMGKSKYDTRFVYIASDDPTVLSDAHERYPDYTFLGDTTISKSAGVGTRYSRESLIGVLSDINILSKCDYLVGTFSSQVSRVAYEIMQTLHADASANAQSLDDIFYFGGQGAHSQLAIYEHESRENNREISFEPGDTIGIAGNHWNGYSKGVNRRTGKVGLYPSYKAKEIIEKADFPPFQFID